MSDTEKISEKIKELLPEAQISDDGRIHTAAAEISTGVKGIHVKIVFSPTIIKINGMREYEYPVSEQASEKFQAEAIEKYADYTVYVSGRSFNINRVFSYQDEEEAARLLNEALDVIRETTSLFETRCVDFQKGKTEQEQDEAYSPEQNVRILDVDNHFHAESVTTQENKIYEDTHREFARKTFEELAQESGAPVRDNGFTFTDPETGYITRCLLSEENQEITVSVSLAVPQDTGAMYGVCVAENYPELMCTWNPDRNEVMIRGYSFPDPCAPDETRELLKLCRAAMDTCVGEYRQTLARKDSAAFAADVQLVLAKQTTLVEEREREIAEREEDLKAAFEKIREKETDIQQKAAKLEEEKAAYESEIQAERDRIREREEEMDAEIRKYEERNAGDILKIQKLANQIALLQSRQNTAPGQGGNDTDGEIFRLKSKVKQLTGQKIALENQLTEKINGKESRIRQLNDTIREKEARIRELEGSVEDQAKNLAAEELRKMTTRIQELETAVARAGHILAPEELMEYLSQDPEIQVKKLHSATARFLSWQDGQLELRVKFGDMDYVEVSCKAVIKDVMFRKLNARTTGAGGDPDIKFFSSSREQKVMARAYFKQTASPEEVLQLVDAICAYFNK